MSRQQRKPPVRRAWLAACGGALAATATPIGAQDQAPEIRGTLRVDVTGSHITRAEMEGALPLQVITRDEIIKGGIQTAQELLERVSANQSFGSFNPALGIGSTLAGYTAASLRGRVSRIAPLLLSGWS